MQNLSSIFISTKNYNKNIPLWENALNQLMQDPVLNPIYMEKIKEDGNSFIQQEFIPHTLNTIKSIIILDEETAEIINEIIITAENIYKEV